jgi:hypothetical protein
MIEEIQHIQTTHTHIPLSGRELINRNILSLRAMTTPSLSAYLYSAREIAETYKRHNTRETGQLRIQQYFQPHIRNDKEQKIHDTITETP